MNEFLWAEILLPSLYAVCVVGVFSFLRMSFGLAISAAICVPLCQAMISFIFQLRYLTGLSILHPLTILLFIGGCFILIWKARSDLVRDLQRFGEFIKSEILVSVLLFITLAYALAEVLFLAPNNHDALVYHLPRIFLFIQQDTLLLDAYSRYHQAVFPLAADILFLPFVELGALRGMGIFSLTSYLSIGASAYVLARHFADKHVAAVTTLIVLSLPVLVLQSVSVKNDLLMAAAGAAALLIALRPPQHNKRLSETFVFSLLCCYGIGCKTTFLAFLPGLAVVLILRWRLYKLESAQALLFDLRRKWQLSICVAVTGIVLSQVWLFAWNIHEHGSWSGPDSFTERHQQHDGLAGAAANAVRYSLQIAQAGPWADQILSRSLGLDPFSAQLNQFYEKNLKPLLKNHGASREGFEITWRLHEDWSWFGPFGAAIFFICLPIALIRKPTIALELLPTLLYFSIICAMISWMPWNGRFFSLFFICLAPVISFTLRYLHPAAIYLIMILAGCSLLSTKIFDFSRPLIPVEIALYEDGGKSVSDIFSATKMQQNAWCRDARQRPLHKGNPDALLSSIEPNASVGIYINTHFRHYGFYAARPDLSWYPLNYLRGSPPLGLPQAWELFAGSEIDYLLCAGIYSQDLEPFLVQASEDGAAHLLRNPHPAKEHSLGIDP